MCVVFIAQQRIQPRIRRQISVPFGKTCASSPYDQRPQVPAKTGRGPALRLMLDRQSFVANQLIHQVAREEDRRCAVKGGKNR